MRVWRKHKIKETSKQFNFATYLGKIVHCFITARRRICWQDIFDQTSQNFNCSHALGWRGRIELLHAKYLCYAFYIPYRNSLLLWLCNAWRQWINLNEKRKLFNKHIQILHLTSCLSLLRALYVIWYLYYRSSTTTYLVNIIRRYFMENLICAQLIYENISTKVL